MYETPVRDIVYFVTDKRAFFYDPNNPNTIMPLTPTFGQKSHQRKQIVGGLLSVMDDSVKAFHVTVENQRYESIIQVHNTLARKRGRLNSHCIWKGTTSERNPEVALTSELGHLEFLINGERYHCQRETKITEAKKRIGELDGIHLKRDDDPEDPILYFDPINDTWQLLSDSSLQPIKLGGAIYTNPIEYVSIGNPINPDETVLYNAIVDRDPLSSSLRRRNWKFPEGFGVRVDDDIPKQQRKYIA